MRTTESAMCHQLSAENKNHPLTWLRRQVGNDEAGKTENKESKDLLRDPRPPRLSLPGPSACTSPASLKQASAVIKTFAMKLIERQIKNKLRKMHRRMHTHTS